MNKRTLFFFFLLALLTLSLYLPALSQSEEETNLYGKGNAHCLKAEWKEAVGVFKKLLGKYPETKYEDVRYWIGHACIEMGQYREGIRWLDEFATRFPRNSYAAEALFRIGEAYEYRIRDYEKALQAYSRVASLYPERIQSLNATQNQANIYAQRAYDYNKAEEYFERTKSMAKVQGVSPESPFVKRADQRMRFIREHSDNNYEPLRQYTRGLNLEEVEKHQEASEVYRKVLKEFPNSAIADDASYRIIECYRALGKKDQVRKEAEVFLRKFPSSPYYTVVRKILSQYK